MEQFQVLVDKNLYQSNFKYFTVMTWRLSAAKSVDKSKSKIKNGGSKNRNTKGKIC